MRVWSIGRMRRPWERCRAPWRSAAPECEARQSWMVPERSLAPDAARTPHPLPLCFLAPRMQFPPVFKQALSIPAANAARLRGVDSGNMHQPRSHSGISHRGRREAEQEWYMRVWSIGRMRRPW